VTPIEVTDVIGVGIPRLQELGFLDQTLRLANAGASYDEIRRGLIGWMEARRDGPAASGRHMGVRRKPGVGGHAETRFMDNASEALAELMRLGWVERTTLPTTAKALPTYRSRRFAVTAAGRDRVALLETDPAATVDALLAAMWPLHPQLSGYYGLLASRGIVVPTLNWTELFPDGVEQFGEKERQRYVDELASRVVDAASVGELGWKPDQSTLRGSIESVIVKRSSRAQRSARPYPYARPQDFTRDCHKGLVRAAFQAAGLNLDFTTHEILRRWGRDMGIANFSYHVPDGIQALRCWGTATFDRDDGVLTPRRRRTAEYGDQIVDELPRAYEDSKRYQGGGGFVPVYALRQLICWRLGLNADVVDRILRDVLEARRPAPFRLIPDRGYAGKVPPTEVPLVLTDSHGRDSAYLLIMLTPNERNRT